VSDDLDDIQFQRTKALVQRRHELHDRDSCLELEGIKLEQLMGRIDSTEAALREESKLAAVADEIVERESFRRKFCISYAGYKPLADRLEQIVDLAEKVGEIINNLYPHLLGHARLAVVSAILIIKKSFDIYCSGIVQT
jgi:hypothetical protein